MRLSEYEIQSIKKSFLNVFKDGSISLFGSRVDDTKKGGDIDLFIQTPKDKATLENKIKFLVMLKEKIGEQKIDVILSRDKSRLIEQEALKNGIIL
jgi:predicted nucleotidyltransferase